MATYRNALEAAYEESQHIGGHAGLAIKSLLDPWSKRDPLALTDAQIAEMRDLLFDAGAEKCLSLFEAALRGTRVLA